ncbi:MAG: ABC transporter permease [Pirellulales bacterium]
MSLWRIAWRSMQQRGLASTLTSLSMALGVSLVVVVVVVYAILNVHFMQGAQGFHLIVGAKGSKQQLVFNTVYHLDQPIENIPYSYYREFVDGRFASSTRVAIPYCLGDSYHAAGETFRVVGTTPDLFEKIEYGRHRDGTPRRYAFEPGGRNIESAHFFEAVLGSIAARKTGLKVGDTFRPAHGIVEEGADAHQHDAFTVVGILRPTGTPNDRVMFVNIEGFYLLEDHAKPPARQQKARAGRGDGDRGVNGDGHEDTDGHEHGHADEQERAASHGQDDGHAHAGGSEHRHAHHVEPLPEGQREVTAILVLVSNELFAQGLFSAINEGQVAQAVFPAREIAKFFDTFLGPIRVILLVLTSLIVVVAGIGILVSIYNSMSDRQREIAVMRALGAGRSTVMAIVLLESILLSLTGGIAGLLLGHGALRLVSPYLVEQTGVEIGFLQFDVYELILIPGLIVLATVVGFLPALAAYRTDVARSLSAHP